MTKKLSGSLTHRRAHFISAVCWVIQAGCGASAPGNIVSQEGGVAPDRPHLDPFLDARLDSGALDRGSLPQGTVDVALRETASGVGEVASPDHAPLVPDAGLRDLGRGEGGREAGREALQDGAGGAPDTGVTDAASPAAPTLPRFILGADITITLEDEHWGATYTDAGKQKSIEQLLKDHGFNFIRISTFVDPGAPGGYAVGKPQTFRDLSHTITLAQRVKKIGLGFLLDLHYSDTWADPSHQTLPSAWTGLGLAALETRLRDYTQDALAKLKTAGALPDIVQVGNEITNGMLWEVGRATGSNFGNFARLLKAGIQAVHEVEPAIPIMLHIEKCHNLRTSEWWLDGVLAQGIAFDILGQSCYAAAPNGVAGYQGSPSDWQSTFSALATRYPQLKFIIAEYSAEQRAANDTMYRLPNARGLGTFNWDPTRAYASHPNHPLFSTNGGWNRFVAIPELMALYDQMATDYGLR